jgi:hypothetical protein
LRSTVDHRDLAIAHDIDDVAGAQPATGVDRRGGGFLIEEVAFEHAWAFQQDFAVAILMPFGSGKR